MKYSDVVRLGLILPKRKKFTQRHVAEAILNSLFKPYQGRTLTELEACFVVRCSAIFHDVPYGKIRAKGLTKPYCMALG